MENWKKNIWTGEVDSEIARVISIPYLKGEK